MGLDVQSTTIKDYAYVDGVVYIFSANGVDIYQPSYVEFIRSGFASLANVTSGAVNDNGIWLGTSDSGVWHCPIGNGDLTGQLKQYYAVGVTYYTIQNNNIASISGLCAVNSTYISYAVSSGIHTLALPSADWLSGDATILTTGSSPALSSNTVNGMKYGSGNNLFLATGDGVDIYDYSDVVTLSSGDINFVWPSSTGAQAAGYVSYVDSSDDIIIYSITNSETVETHAGTFLVCWIDDQADLALYDDELEQHAFIDHISPTNNAIDVTRTWSIYFEIGDTINGLSSSDIVLKVNDVAVTKTVAAFGSGFSSGFSSGFGGEGFVVTYTPPSASGYRETIFVEVTATDGAGESFSESGSFITETSAVTTVSSTKPPNVIVYKDLSLSDAEDTYNSVEVNWIDERISAYYVDEDQAKASAQVIIEDGIYHKHDLTVRLLDTDASSNDTQDIKKGNLITLDCASLGLTNQKCEVLSKQRSVIDDRIEYTLTIAYYVVWS
jgi:hypothetical protein